MSSRNSSIPRKRQVPATAKENGSLAKLKANVELMLAEKANVELDGFEVFSAYGLIFGLHQLVLLYPAFEGGLSNVPPGKAFFAVLCIASCSGSVPLVFGAHVWALVLFYDLIPYSDRAHWVAHHDMAIVLVFLSAFFTWSKKEGKLVVFPSNSDHYKSLVDGFATLVRPQMVLWYFGTGFWKLNRDFFDPSSNCATSFLMQVVAAYLPESLTADWLVKLVAWSAPSLVVAVEVAIPLFFVFPGWSSRCGVALGLLMHLLIAVTPPPHNVGIYGVSLAARYFFFLPEATAMVIAEIKMIIKSIFLVIREKLMLWSGSTKPTKAEKRPSFAAGGALLGAALLVYGAMHFATGMPTINPYGLTEVACDWTIPGYVAQVLLYSRALYLDANTKISRQPCNGRKRWKKLWWFVVVEGVFFCYGVLILGLGDNGPPRPFSSIRVHGGSNHWLVPTGLIQRLVGHHPYFAGSPLSSEVIRVDNTNSSYLNGLYPSEITEQLKPSRTYDLLKLVGHNARIFCPVCSRYMMPGGVTRNQPGPHFLPYTLPSFEIRRLLPEARQLKESFFLEYTRLSRYDAYQAGKATGPRVRLLEDGKGGQACTMVDKDVPCDANELVLLPPLGYWASKHMIFWPYPILPEQSEGLHGYCHEA